MQARAAANVALLEWDWRYQVGFDTALADKVGRSAACLSLSSERHSLQSALAWGKSFVSLDRLLDALHRDELSTEALRAVQPDIMLHLPGSLAAGFARRIAQMSSRIDSSSSQHLDVLFESALDAAHRPLSRTLFEALLGPYFEEVLRIAGLAMVQPRPARQPMSRTEARSFVADFLRESAAHPLIRNRVDVSKVEVGFREGTSGYAEYWSRDVSPNAKFDKLIVHLNDDSCERLALAATLYHEIHGHAVFYELLRSSAPSFVDHGALTLIEGWATGCEWELSDQNYARWARSQRLRSLRLLDATPAEVTASLETPHPEMGGKLHPEVRLIEEFQYPGLAASYGLGGVWFEAYVGVHGIDSFSERLRGRSWGDFMASW